MSERHRYAIAVVGIVVLQGLLSCVHLPAESGSSIQETTPLERIGIADLGDRLRVEVDGGRPVGYSMSSTVEPASVTVDLPGLSKGRRFDRDRLIVDLANVTSPLRLQVLPVDHPLLKQIRIGHHSQKVRLVLDLPQPADYSVKPGRNQLAVKLTPSTEPDASGRPAKSGEAREGEFPAGNVRVAVAGRVPFPERLANIESGPRLAQMAPEIKGSAGPEDIMPPRYVGRRISLDFQGADISNVLRLIADVSGFNIVVGEGVKAKVTLKLISVPWDQALDMMLKVNNLGMIREGNIVWIDSLTNIARQQDEEAKTKESKIKAEDLVTRIVYVQNVTAQEIQTTLRSYLSPRGQLQVNPAVNGLIVQDTESRIASFTQLVRELDLE